MTNIIEEEEYTGRSIADTVKEDSTGSNIVSTPIIKSRHISDFEEEIYIRYLNFGKYRIGLIEKKNHEVIDIKSVEVTKRLYSDEQLSKRFNYWDVEKYYQEE